MDPKTFSLNVAWRIVVVIIQSGLTNRHDFGMRGQIDKLISRYIAFFGGIVRMGADRAINCLVVLGNFEYLIEFFDRVSRSSPSGAPRPHAHAPARRRDHLKDCQNRDGSGCRQWDNSCNSAIYTNMTVEKSHRISPCVIPSALNSVLDQIIPYLKHLRSLTVRSRS